MRGPALITVTQNHVHCAPSQIAVSYIPLALWDKGRGEGSKSAIRGRARYSR